MSHSHSDQIKHSVQSQSGFLLNFSPQPDGSTHVHILTDCRYVANAGNQQVTRKKHTALWKLLDSFQRDGFVITYHWIPRDILDANKQGHNLANTARIGALHLNSEEILCNRGFDSIFEIHPS